MPKSSGKRRPDNGVHVFPVRVYYANYLRYAERARTEMLRGIGMGSARMMEADGLAFAVRRCSMEFVKPAKLDDLLDVETRLVEVGGASVIADQRIKRDATDLVRMKLTLACMSLAGRPARLPAGLRARLAHMQATVP